jgi:rare lipoprotein A (peptidoglycan hydrolase)
MSLRLWRVFAVELRDPESSTGTFLYHLALAAQSNMCGEVMSAMRTVAAASVVALSLWSTSQTADESTPDSSNLPAGWNAQSGAAPLTPSTQDVHWPDPKSMASGSSAHAAHGAFVGKASFYAYRGGKTASGEQFKADALTAAHRTLPFGTRLRVTDLKTQKSVEVVVTDRGPHLRGLVLDLSLGAAKALGIVSRGITQVRAEVVSG